MTVMMMIIIIIIIIWYVVFILIKFDRIGERDRSGKLRCESTLRPIAPASLSVLSPSLPFARLPKNDNWRKMKENSTEWYIE